MCVRKEFDQGQLLGSQRGVDPGGRDGGESQPSGIGEDQASGCGEGGGRGSCGDEDWSSHGAAHKADGEGDSE